MADEEEDSIVDDDELPFMSSDLNCSNSFVTHN